MDRLNYHTSIVKDTESKGGVSAEGTTVAPLKPWFPAYYHTSIVKDTESKGGASTEGTTVAYYHTSLQSSRIALENLNKFNNKLDQNNILTNAFLAQNPFISDEEREIFNKQMKEKALQELHLYERCIQRIKEKQNEIS